MNSIRRWYQEMIRPAPLDNFDDYDDYWHKRKVKNILPPLMPRYQIIADRIPDGTSVLDIGCGDGSFLRHLHSIKPSCELFGADISKNAIGCLQEWGFKGQLITAEQSLIEQFDKKFDYVVMMEVIEHVHDAEGLVLQAAKITRQRLFITVPNVGFIMYRLRLGFFGRFPVTSICCHIKEHIRFWTVQDFIEWIERLGLKLRGIKPQVSREEPWIARTLAYKNPGLFSKSVIYEIEP